MFSVARYQETIEAEQGSLSFEHYDDKIDAELEHLRIEEKSLKREVKRLDKAIRDNKNFEKFIGDMKLLVQGSDGNVIRVSSDNIIGFNDAVEYLLAKHKILNPV